MIYKSIKKQFIKQRRENERLKSELLKRQADIDYIAMMCDVELETEEKEEVAEDEQI